MNKEMTLLCGIVGSTAYGLAKTVEEWLLQVRGVA